MQRNRHSIIKLSLVTASLFCADAYANNFAMDGRGNGMGGTGVVSATYLTAPFYNPALGTIYRQNDDVGMILPGIGIGYVNQDDMINDVEHIADIIDNPANYSPSEIESAFDALNGDQMRTEIGAIAAFAIPNPYISTNMFAKLYNDSYATSLIPELSDPLDRAESTSVQAVSIGIVEVGVNFAKYANLFGQHMSFGIAPKFQQVYTYVDSGSVNSFDPFATGGELESESGLNIDAGALWFYGPLRVGLAGKNLIGKSIETAQYTEVIGSQTYNIGYTYELTPVYTVGLGYVDDYMSFSVDYDLNSDKRFDAFDDDVKMLRVGAEFDLARQMQLRVGYKSNQLSDEDVYTAGLGISPFGLFHLDAAVNYNSMDNLGIYANFLVYY
jgi:hypothetical protein